MRAERLAKYEADTAAAALPTKGELLRAADAAIDQLMHFFQPCGWDGHTGSFDPTVTCGHPECVAVQNYLTLKGKTP